MNLPGVRGERVRLVPLDRALHLENFLVWLNDPEVSRWLKHYLPITRAREEKWFERMSHSRSDIGWAVLDENGRHIGATGIHRIDWKNRNALTGTVLGDREAWGRGYGADVMRTRTAYAFEQVGLHRLESACYAANEASRRCLEKTGYRQFGVAHRRVWRHAAWQDLLLYEILAEDWLAAHPRG